MGLDLVVQEPAEEGGYDNTPIPDDTMVNATLLGTQVKSKQYKDEPAPVDRLVWKFRIEDPPYFDRYVWGETGVKLINHPNCKLFTWSQAVLGFDLPVGYQFDTDDLDRRPCRILIGAREGTNKRNEPQTYNYVEEVLPAAADATAPVGVAAGASDLEEPFVVDAATWWPDARLGSAPQRLLTSER
jgi:hypothetical protein